MNKMISNAIAGILAGVIAFLSNSLVQFLLNSKIDFFEAFLTALIISIVFFILTFRYSKNTNP